MVTWQVRDVIYIRLGVGQSVAFAGSRFNRGSGAERVLPPVRALVLRLQKKRLQKQRDAVLAAVGTPP